MLIKPYRLWIPVSLMFATLVGKAGPISSYNLAEVVTCVGSFSSGCTLQDSSSGASITSSGTVTTSGESVFYTASSVSAPGSLGGVVSVSSNTLNSSGPGIMVDALEQLLDSVTISFAPLNGQTGSMLLYYTLDGANSAVGTNVGVPYACVKLGINNPTFPFGCTAFPGSSVNGTFSAGVFTFTYGTAFPLWFQLESIAGTGFGPGRPTGTGSSDASFFNTATIAGFVLYDQNGNPLSGTPNIISALGISYQTVPEPSTAALLVAGIFCLLARRRLE